MDSPPPTPPDITGDDWYWRHKDAFERLDWKGKHLELPKSAIAETVEQAKKDLENAKLDVEEAQERVEDTRGYPPDILAKKKLELADASWVSALMEVRLLQTMIAKRTEKSERTTGPLEPTGKTTSTLFPGVIGGLKTRRRKHRNGPSAVFRNRARRLSRRKIKA